MPLKSYKDLNPREVIAIYLGLIAKLSYAKLAEMKKLREIDIYRIGTGYYFREVRKEFPRLKELKAEMKRRNSRSNTYFNAHKKSKVKKLWLSGLGREKICKQTGLSDPFVKQMIREFIAKGIVRNP